MMVEVGVVVVEGDCGCFVASLINAAYCSYIKRLHHRQHIHKGRVNIALRVFDDLSWRRSDPASINQEPRLVFLSAEIKMSHPLSRFDFSCGCDVINLRMRCNPGKPDQKVCKRIVSIILCAISQLAAGDINVLFCLCFLLCLQR